MGAICYLIKRVYKKCEDCPHLIKNEEYPYSEHEFVCNLQQNDTDNTKAFMQYLKEKGGK